MMAKTTVNLTVWVVTEEVDSLLEQSLNPVQQGFFDDPVRRRELIAYVLTRVPNTHVLVASDDRSCLTPKYQLYPLEQRLRIEAIACEGIQVMLRSVVDHPSISSARGNVVTPEGTGANVSSNLVNV